MSDVVKVRIFSAKECGKTFVHKGKVFTGELERTAAQAAKIVAAGMGEIIEETSSDTESVAATTAASADSTASAETTEEVSTENTTLTDDVETTEKTTTENATSTDDVETTEKTTSEDVTSTDDVETTEEAITENATSTDDVKTFEDVAGVFAEELVKIGVTTLKQLADAESSLLQTIEGVGAKTAEKLKAAANAAITETVEE